MSVRLTVTQRSEAGAAQGTEVVVDDAVITLGRDKSCQVHLPQQAVSRNHARISQEGTLYFLEDLGSAYGTQVNGKPLPKGEKRPLKNGDVIAIAQYDVRFERLSELAVNSENTAFIARDALRLRRTGPEGRYLRILNGPREGEKIEIADAQEIVFGRDDKEADIVFKDDLVSRRHVKVRRDWSGTHVEDLGSRNGIKVNKKRVNRKALKDGDELEVGSTRLVYVDPTDPAEEPVQISTSTKAPAPPPSPSKVLPKVEQPEPEPEPEPEPVGNPDSQSEQPVSASDASGDEPAGDGESSSDPVEEPEPPVSASMPEVAQPAGGMAALRDKSKLVPLVVMGLVGLVFLVLMIAVLAGA